MYDEAAVLVGDAKTIDDSEDILKVVKKLKPACLENMPSIYAWRHGTGLKRAFLTTNPLIPAQYLYPGPRTVPAGMAHAPHGAKPGEKFDPFVAAASLMQRRPADKFVRSLNKGNRSLYKNPGPYTLQVAEFVGRQSLDTNNNKESVFDLGLKNSPLRTAHEDAEKLADSIAKCQSAAGLQPYVYHDRTSSKVFLGSFAGPHDPNLKRCIDVLPKVSNELLQRGFTQLLLSPATMLSEIPED
jgi:hypothetical protein